MERKNNYYFYVLECNDGSFYGGYTVDIDRRLSQHNEGTGAKYTRARRPVKLIYSERFPTKREAMKKEAEFKKLTRRKKEQFLQKAGVLGNANTEKFCCE